MFPKGLNKGTAASPLSRLAVTPPPCAQQGGYAAWAATPVFWYHRGTSSSTLRKFGLVPVLLLCFAAILLCNGIQEVSELQSVTWGYKLGGRGGGGGYTPPSSICKYSRDASYVYITRCSTTLGKIFHLQETMLFLKGAYSAPFSFIFIIVYFYCDMFQCLDDIENTLQERENAFFKEI